MTESMISLRDAEIKLLETKQDMTLRHVFRHPQGTTAEGVFVEPELCMNRGKGNPRQDLLAREVSQICTKLLSSRYLAKNREEAKLILKIYLLNVSDGNRESRIYAPTSGTGLVVLTMGWVLALADGSIVLDGGRVHQLDSHWMGIGDILHLSDPERTLQSMAQSVCHKILKATAIPSERSWLQAC